MGRIVEGTITGTLPDRVAFAIDYPGYPSSVERAVQTLGGEEGLAKVRTSESNFLELKFRPEDPFAHPAFGELRHTSDLVLRLSRRTFKRSPGCQAVNASLDIVEQNACGQTRTANEELEGQAQQHVEAEVIAKVEHTYTFDGMADYQYVMAVHANGPNHSHKQKGMVEIPMKEMEPSELTMLVPPLFSTKDIPEEIFLRQPVGRKRKQLVISAAEGQETQAPCFALEFKIKEVPKEGNWELNLDRGTELWLRTAALVRLFQERPIWTRTMLNERLIEQGITVTDYYLKSLLFRIAYYFGSGPFRNLWIRNGYDPRLDPESRAYQMMDFRVPFMLRSQAETPPSQATKLRFSDICAFKIVPQKKFTQFQLVDMQDDDIQTHIEKPPERKTCSETTGWYRASTIKRLRQIIRLRYLALFPGKVARALEDAERRNWERSKLEPEIEKERPCDDDADRSDLNMHSSVEAVQDDGHRMGEEGNEKSTSHPFSVPEDQLNPIDDDEDEDDEDEGDIGEDVDQLDDDGLKANLDEEEEEEDDDEEEEEEELEEDTEGLLSGQSMGKDQGPPYLDATDNIPKNYLQALLGKFASKRNGDQGSSVLDLDEDAQYAIYEPDEDDDE